MHAKMIMCGALLVLLATVCNAGIEPARVGERCTLGQAPAGYPSRSCADGLMCNASELEGGSATVGVCLVRSDCTTCSNHTSHKDKCKDAANGYKVDEIDISSLANVMGSCYGHDGEHFCDSYCLSLRQNSQIPRLHTCNAQGFFREFLLKDCDRVFAKSIGEGQFHYSNGASSSSLPSSSTSSPKHLNDIDVEMLDMNRTRAVAKAFEQAIGDVRCTADDNGNFCLSHIEKLESMSLTLLPSHEETAMSTSSVCMLLASAGCCAERTVQAAASIQGEVSKDIPESSSARRQLWPLMSIAEASNGNPIDILAQRCREEAAVELQTQSCSGIHPDNQGGIEVRNTSQTEGHVEKQQQHRKQESEERDQSKGRLQEKSSTQSSENVNSQEGRKQKEQTEHAARNMSSSQRTRNTSKRVSVTDGASTSDGHGEAPQGAQGEGVASSQPQRAGESKNKIVSDPSNTTGAENPESATISAPPVSGASERAGRLGQSARVRMKSLTKSMRGASVTAAGLLVVTVGLAMLGWKRLRTRMEGRRPMRV